MKNNFVSRFLFTLSLRLTFFIPNPITGTIISNGEKRGYLLYVPPGYDPARPSPLVICIHGYAEWPAHQREISRWNALAEQHAFLVVYPSGTGFPRHWRTSAAPGRDNDAQRDVNFISSLIDQLQEQYNLDPARIYANGLSNGGGMSFVLACKLAGRIAAIGSVAGAYLLPWEACQPSRPVPAILVHGTADPIVPYQGGPSGAFNIPFPAVPTWVEELARRNGCMDAPVPIRVSEAVSGLLYPGGTPNGEVVFYTIRGGGHTWPGSKPLPGWLAGPTSQEIDATQTMWEFFVRHPLDAA